MIHCYGDQIKINDIVLSSYDIKDKYEDFNNPYHKDIAYIYMSQNALSPLPTMTVCGIDFMEDAVINVNNKSILTAGRLPEADNEAVVNERLLAVLELNNVDLGDTVSLRVGTVNGNFTIVGLFDGTYFDYTSGQGDDLSFFCAFLTPITAINAFSGMENIKLEKEAKNFSMEPEGYKMEPEAFINNTTYFYLNSSKDYPAFIAELEKLNNTTGSHYTARFVRGGNNEFEESYADTLRIARFFITSILAVSAALVILMAALLMHERRYEIGVYLSIGMGKYKIWLLFACELLFFIFAVFIPGLATGLALTPYAYASLVRGNLRLEGAAADPATAGLILAAAVGLALLSSAVCAVSILRYPPMSVLRSRS